MKPYELTITEALRTMENKELSSVELTRSCLDRIDSVDQQLSAFITVDEKGALEQAEQADKDRENGTAGKLCGIPVSIKDLLCTKGLKTTCGSKILANFIPPYDATVVKNLKKEGAVIIGKVTMDEFAMGSTSENCAFGIPRNPWKKGYVAGGSSGGSAVSVAAYECCGSLGSDTGGSIRQPASLCGVVGLKPTYGRVSRYGLTAFASSLDQVGPFSRSVEDCSRIMEVISGYDAMDSTSVKKDVPDYQAALVSGMKGMKIGIPKEYFSAGLDPEVESIVQNGIEVLRQQGAEVVEVSLPRTDYCVAAYYIIAPSEASSNLARYDGVVYGYRKNDMDSLEQMYRQTRSEGFGAEVKRRILIGTYALSSGYYDAYYKKASQVRTLIVNDFKKVFAECDLLVSPVTPTPAWKMGENSDNPLAVYMSDILTISANLAGIPGMSVPGGFTSQGLPVGIQLQGAHFQEEKLLRAGFNLENGLKLEKRELQL
ncbi:Asp-tRNA(Asn)/Glu-tRNA(Gln) amidotransferase subunit GatA [Desulforhopalus singaporensis]|uniref:Glutamyl-tRNA(Gln) amidotransferase subunit A n=1 Tax=Desulforhopalus singaporensis TaxID=91360 RepID=A0A1H0VAV9_9BACT|nr:Asp-tRNA(Asn)/Glu-tRNA(Gln) amidotransferase subunit GatA [Desulforhopalus singaporensis]SDP75226.1 aspartyl/glutamyl-tRNA(Asn/Gln) amidotransferase subunit A [Desulforhopalus singaporensis]